MKDLHVFFTSAGSRVVILALIGSQLFILKIIYANFVEVVKCLLYFDFVRFLINKILKSHREGKRTSDP